MEANTHDSVFLVPYEVELESDLRDGKTLEFERSFHRCGQIKYGRCWSRILNLLLSLRKVGKAQKEDQRDDVTLKQIFAPHTAHQFEKLPIEAHNLQRRESLPPSAVERDPPFRLNWQQT